MPTASKRSLHMCALKTLCILEKRFVCVYIVHTLCLCEHVCVFWVEGGGSLGYVGDLELTSFS